MKQSLSQDNNESRNSLRRIRTILSEGSISKYLGDKVRVFRSKLKSISMLIEPNLDGKWSRNSVLLASVIFITTFLVASIYFKEQQNHGYLAGALKTTVISGFESLNSVIDANIPKFEDRYTTFLLLGVDSRSPVIENGYIRSKSGFEDINTDTIMQIIYDHQENRLFMISIPRDLGHSYKNDPCLYQYNDFHPRNSINHVYKFGYMGDCPGGGIGMLKKYIMDVTGFPVHYYAVVDLESFIDVINIVGDEKDGKRGLYIDVPETIKSWYPYEITKGYIPVYIPSGHQFLTSQEILYYSRVRIGYDDYHRARRQQIVIDALKTKLTSSELYDDPLLIWHLISEFKDKVVYSKITLEDIRGIAGVYHNLIKAKVYKLVLDNKLGGLNKILQSPSYSRDGNHHINGWYLIPTTWQDDTIEDKFIYVKRYVRGFINNSIK